MTPEKLFHELLGLGLNWEGIESRFDQKSGTVYLEMRATARLWESVRCPKDPSVATCYDHTEILTWRHLDIFQHRSEIICRLPRRKGRTVGLRNSDSPRRRVPIGAVWSWRLTERLESIAPNRLFCKI